MNISSRSAKRALGFFLVLASSFPSVSRADATLKRFVVKGTQLKQLEKAFWERLWHSQAGFDSCVRRMFSNKELLTRPPAAEDYEILSFFKGSMTSEKANTFPFLNSHGEAWTCAISNGYCMGMSSLERDLNILLVFDPTESLEKLPKFASDQEKSDYFEDLIFNVWKDKSPAVVPGYANLNTFTADPVVRKIFMSAVPENWGDHASIPAIAFGVLAKSRRHIEEKEVLEQISRLKDAKAKGYNPLMYLGGVEEGSPKLARGVLESARVHPHGLAADAAKAGLDEAPSAEEVRAALAKAKGESDGTLESMAMTEPKHFTRSIGDAYAGAKDADHTYIHVVQVLDVKELGPRKWDVTAIDPNGYAPKNVATLHVDLDAKPPIFFNGASASLELNSFGQLPGDREHMAEIVTNVLGYAKLHPNIFAKAK